MNTSFLNTIYNEFVQSTAQIYIDEAMHSHSLFSVEFIKQRALFAGENDGTEILKKLDKGWLIFERQGQYHRSIIPIVDKIKGKKKAIENFNDKESMLHFLTECFKVSWGTTNYEQEQLYQVSKGLLDSQSWEEAYPLQIFFTFLFPRVSEFWHCLGIIEQHFNYDDTALHCFLQAHLLNPTLVHPCLHIIECCLQLGDYTKAKDVLAFLDRMLEIKKYDLELISKAKILRESVNAKCK